MTGDGLLPEIDDVANAVHVGFDLMAGAERANAGLPDNEWMRFRIGINLGDVVTAGDDDIFGHDVNIACRLLSLAEPGEIVTTAQVRDAMFSEFDTEFEDLGAC